MARRNKSIFRSMSNISCCVLCKCNCTLFLASHTSDDRLFRELFVVLQQFHTELFTLLINASAVLRSCDDVARTDCDLQIPNEIVSQSHCDREGNVCRTELIDARAASCRPHFDCADSRIVLLDAAVVVDAATVVIQLMANGIDANCVLLVNDILFKRMLGGTQVRQYSIDLKAFTPMRDDSI